LRQEHDSPSSKGTLLHESPTRYFIGICHIITLTLESTIRQLFGHSIGGKGKLREISKAVKLCSCGISYFQEGGGKGAVQTRSRQTIEKIDPSQLIDFQ
jgi:hypothetical protein